MKQVALGLGCDRDCAVHRLEAAALGALAVAGLAPADVGVIVSIDQKADEPALKALAQNWDVPIRFFAAAVLERETWRLKNPSGRIFALMGCHGVAEAAALAAVGPDGLLLVPKQKSEGVTVAIAGWL
jgi:cobalamin biosynthesis protein CbiG